jgi:hypothetical protein
MKRLYFKLRFFIVIKYIELKFWWYDIPREKLAELYTLTLYKSKRDNNESV